MVQIPRTRSRAALCAAAVAASCAALLPAPAWGDEGVASTSPTATDVAPTLGLDTTLDDGAAEAIEEAAEALDAAMDATNATADAVTADGTDEIEPEPEQSAASEDEPETASDPASEAASKADTTTDSADTATDSTVPATAGDDEAPMATATPDPAPVGAAINVNVSVRIGSAGDNGAVSQTNTAAVPSATVASTSGPTRSGSAPASSASTVSASGSAASPWYWEWNCSDLPALPVVSPTSSSSESFPSSWTWVWNCGGNSEQYHPETDDQYQQSNTNVSIRISSPGDNGAVTQTNISISAGASPISPPRIEIPTVSVTTPPITVTAPGASITIPSIVVTTPMVTEGLPLVSLPGDSADAAAWGNEIFDVAVANEIGPAPAATGEPMSSAATLAPAGGDRAVRIAGARNPAATGAPPPAAHMRAVTFAVRAGASGGASAGTGPGPRQTKPAPRWKPSGATPEPRAPVSPASSTSASAAGAGGSTGGGIPIFLALPFLAAMLDLARRVALDRVTWPSGHRRRVPDTPG